MCGDPNMMKRAYVLSGNRKWIYWPHTINANSSTPIDGFSRTKDWGRNYYLGLSPSRGWPRDCCCPFFANDDRDPDWNFPVPRADILIGIGLPGRPTGLPLSHFPSHQSYIASPGLFPNIFYQKDIADPVGTRRHQFGMIAYGLALNWNSITQSTVLEMWIAIHERNYNIQFTSSSEEYFRGNFVKILFKNDLSDAYLHFFPCKMEGTIDFDYTIATDVHRVYYYRTAGGAETINSDVGTADPLYPALWSTLLSTCTIDWVESVWHRTACTYGCNA